MCPRTLCVLMGLALPVLAIAGEEAASDAAPAREEGTAVVPEVKPEPAAGDSGKLEDPKPIEHVELQFISLSVDAEAIALDLRLSDEKSLAVVAPTDRLSECYHVQYQNVWALGDSAAGEGRKRAFVVRGQAPALKAEKQVLVLVSSGIKNPEGIEEILVMPILNGEGGFCGGKFLFMNVTDVDVIVVIGGERRVLEPGKYSIIQPQTDEKTPHSTHVSIDYRDGDRVRPFFSTRWPTSAFARGFIGIDRDAETRKLRIQTILDCLDQPVP